jgi:hypothetical protein
MVAWRRDLRKFWRGYFWGYIIWFWINLLYVIALHVVLNPSPPHPISGLPKMSYDSANMRKTRDNFCFCGTLETDRWCGYICGHVASALWVHSNLWVRR